MLPHMASRNSYPGGIVSYLDGKTPVSETRVFVGNCVPAYQDAVVWYQRWRDEKRTWHSGVFIARVLADKLDEIPLTKNVPAVAATMKRVRRGACREIPGINGTSEP